MCWTWNDPRKGIWMIKISKISLQHFRFLLCIIVRSFIYMQGYNARKVNCSCVHIETSSLWAEFVKKNRCISVRLVSEEVKSINFDDFDNSHNSFLWPEYFIDFLCERRIPWQASTSVLCLHYRPETIHCSTKDAHTSEITFLALLPCLYGSLHAAPGILQGLRWLKLGKVKS